MIRTEYKFATKESAKSGKRLRDMRTMRRNQPVISFRISSTRVLFKFSQTYADYHGHSTPKAKIILLTMSSRLGVRITFAPFGR